MRISFFFFFSCLFGMRNHYSKYEITKGSCPPASCRREKDDFISSSSCESKRLRARPLAWCARVLSSKEAKKNSIRQPSAAREQTLARREENRRVKRTDNGRRGTSDDEKERRVFPVPFPRGTRHREREDL